MRIPLWFLVPVLAAAQPAANIRVDVDLIQVDVTVTDRSGKRVTGLTAADFEVKRDGKKQPVTAVLWVPGQRVNQPPPVDLAQAQAGAGKLRPENVRRTIGILIDDMSLSFSSLHVTREAIKQLVQEGIDSQDLVAVYRTSRGLSLMQQFTTNRQQLLASLDRVRNSSLTAFDPQAPASADLPDPSTGGSLASIALQSRLREDSYNREVLDIRTAAALGAMNLAVRGLRELPGRKSLVMFTEGIQLMDVPPSVVNPNLAPYLDQSPGATGGRRSRTEAAARSLIDTANRAGVTIYTIDPRGLTTNAVEAADLVLSGDGRAVNNLSAQRAMNQTLSQDGMHLLAEETGGVFYGRTNDITGSLRSALGDQEGYYLLAFKPDRGTFEKEKAGPKFQRLTVKVGRPGVAVRYRRSFYGAPEPPPVKGTPLVNALFSPFASEEIPVRLTPVFLHSATSGPFLRTLLHVDAAALEFKTVPAETGDADQEPWQQTTVNEVIVVFDETGKAVDQMANPQPLKVRGRSLQMLREQGLDQQVDVPLSGPGPYQVRVAVADVTSGKTGSAAQFLVVPDLKRNRLALSGVLLSSVAWAEGQDPAGSAAQRIVRRGGELEFGLSVYNARRVEGGAAADLVSQMRLFRDGKLLFTGKKTPVAAADRKIAEKAMVRGRVRVTTPPGEYVLEIAVQDQAVPAKQQVAVRYVDFSVRE